MYTTVYKSSNFPDIFPDIDKMVSMGVTNADKSLGALYFLTGLVIVSKECAQALPYLLQN